MCSCTGWERRLWNLFYGLSVSYTVHIHAAVRSFSLSLSLIFYSTQTKPNKHFPHLSVIYHVPTLLSYLCSVFKIKAYILSVIIKQFFSALNPLIWRVPKLMRWTEPNHFRHCWFSETLSSIPELLLTLKSSLCLLEYISDLCLLLLIWSIRFCHETAWVVLPHRTNQGLCAVLGVNVTLTVLSAHQTDTCIFPPVLLIRWILLHFLLSHEHNSNVRQYNPVLTLILI